MYRKCQILKQYVEMIGASKSEEEALEAVVKIVLDARDSKEVQNAAEDYVNEAFDYAATS